MKLFKKSVLILSVLLVLNLTIYTSYNQSSAAPVVSKVVSSAAKKVAKEVVKDQAVRQSMTMVMNYKYTPKKEEKIQKPKASFEMVCLPENRKADKTCSKPMQVKKNLTTQDKKNIGTEAGKLLDKKMGHKGWKKFLDWFFPIWIIGAVITTVDLLMDGDLSSFFSDIGYEALVNLGLITNLSESPNFEPIDYGGFVPKYDTDDFFNDEENVELNNRLGDVFEYVELPEGISLARNSATNTVSPFYISSHVLVFKSDKPYYYQQQNGEYRLLFDYYYPYIHLRFTIFGKDGKRTSKVRWLNNLDLYYSSVLQHENKNTRKIETLDNLSDPRIYLNKYYDKSLNDDELNHLIYLAKDFFDSLIIAPPEPMPELKPQGVPVTKPGTTVTVPSPESVPVVDKNTGTQVRPGPGSTVENPIWTTPDGTPVQEDDIVIDDIETVETPDGTVIKKPESNPNVEEGTIPNPNPENPLEPNNPTDPENPTDPDDTFPDGESCDARFEKPRFDKLGKEISTTFPFNIPFDLFKSFTNIFVNMGDKKPSFDWDIDFMGDVTTINITIPEFFDKWRPFIHSIVIFGFDVALLFLIYRFIGGR